MSLNPRLSGLRCSACDRQHNHRRLQGVCEACGRPLLAGYRLVPEAPPASSEAPASLWRYAGVLPVAPAAAVTLGEGWTPLLPVSDGLWVKDEAQNPTGSFKARGMSVAVSAARALGAGALAAPSAGNAATALAAYGTAAGLPVVVALPADTPRPLVEECRRHGTEVHLVEGTIAEAGAWLSRHGPPGAVDLSTLREPYRVEGKKTIAYELWEQLGGRLPDVIVCPTGGGTALVGIWKALGELEALGWLGEGAGQPRLVCVQAEGCAPVVRAFETGADDTKPWTGPAPTAAYGLRVPSPIGGALCLRALRETGGTAVAVPEAAIAPAARDLSSCSGVDAAPEAGAAWGAVRHLREEGWLVPGEQVVVLNTGRNYRA